MVTVQGSTAGVMIDPANIDGLLEKEWLLSNQRGSYAAGTVLGCNTRRYHGLLVASLRPPVERVVALSGLLEAVEVGGEVYELANFEFSDRMHPQGYKYLQEFRRGAGVHFRYDLGCVTVEKSIYLAADHDVVVICYDFSGGGSAGRFSLRPLVALRDFHALQSSSASLEADQVGDVVTARVLDPHGPAVHMSCRGASFSRHTDWWYAMHYRQELRRGQHDYEDVWAPGCWEMPVADGERVTLVVQAEAGPQRPGLLEVDVDELVEQLRGRDERLYELAGAVDEQERQLVKAADQFVVRRQMASKRDSASILAGYYWFADWGRDTFISLPGLLLETGRIAEAREVLETFAGAVDAGMIPNCFDDYTDEPHYNSVDASLWFINAAYEYLLATDDKTMFSVELGQVAGQIIEAYSQGTRFGIHADDDGLITGGDADTQLTWMDARCNGVSFTPRYGKAVEINALWINALRIMGQTAEEAAARRRYESMAQKAAESFAEVFWNEEVGCLNDCVLPDGTADATIRPNQIFAVALRFSPLTPAQQSAVVAVVERELLTPYGLRSLSPGDPRYQGHYEGDQFQRDSAYHQGTVWGYLIGPFVRAYLEVNDYSGQAIEQGRQMIAPLLGHLNDDGILGSVSEIFDGDWPHQPRGCGAQAWSVAALLSCKKLLDKGA